jgi:glycosyltransferase involved in cell wall biosynthesis
MTTPSHPPTERLRVAALVDLPRSPQSGGHVKCWERLAQAAAESELPLDLTVYFSGIGADEAPGSHVRLRHLPPVFSTSRLKFLPYMPDTADLAPWHGRLARELTQYDVLHTTDGFFAFARTAAKVGRRRGIPLVTSFHTDTPSYTRIFTRQTIEKLTGRWPGLTEKMVNGWKLPDRQGLRMERKLAGHIRACSYALATRPEDQVVAEKILGPSRVKPLRLGIDKVLFGTHRADRRGVLRDYRIAQDRVIALFVGRVDQGKNIGTLIDAAEQLIAEGAPLHVIVAGVGPATEEVRRRLGPNASLPGFVKPEELARLYASVDVLTMTSEVEIRSMVGGEALISGCPVLVSEKSGVAPLFHNTPAMQVVAGGSAAWTKALGDFVGDRGRHGLMRMAAINYGEHFLASWQEVLSVDLLPVWQLAAAGARRKAA